MQFYQLGFKTKLRLVMMLTVVGFAIIAYMSLSALRVLDVASSKVTELNSEVAVLKNLQIKVLILNNKPSTQTLKILAQEGQESINKLINILPTDEKTSLEEIKQSLVEWTSLRQEWLEYKDSIGIDVNSGLRADVEKRAEDLKTGLFSNFRKGFDQLKNNINTFIEQRTQVQYQEVIATAKALNEQATKIGLEDNVVPKLTSLEAAVKQISVDIFRQEEVSKSTEISYQTLEKAIEQKNAYFENKLKKAEAEAEEVSSNSKLKVLIISLLVALVVMALLLSVSQSVVTSLSIMSEVLKKLSAGDLTKRLDVNSVRNDELDQVSNEVNNMASALNDVLVKVAKSSQDLDSGALSLRENLVSMVANNANTNEETTNVASAIEEVSSTMISMLDSTNAALVQSQSAQDSADKGDIVVKNAARSMVKLASVFDDLNGQASNLEQASEKIDNVTDMINNLAGQTNLLALNAAIEAARAGDAGRGFSVVASEVRSLAEKTVDATQNIDEIIRTMHDSITSLLKTMEDGTGYVTDGREQGSGAAEAIDQIKELVHEVTEKNQELTSNISEATDATSIIARSIDSLSGNVASNTQQSLEVQSYVEEVSDNANELMTMTKQFTFK